MVLKNARTDHPLKPFEAVEQVRHFCDVVRGRNIAEIGISERFRGRGGFNRAVQDSEKLLITVRVFDTGEQPVIHDIKQQFVAFHVFLHVFTPHVSGIGFNAIEQGGRQFRRDGTSCFDNVFGDDRGGGAELFPDVVKIGRIFRGLVRVVVDDRVYRRVGRQGDVSLIWETIDQYDLS
jgi:hypothetical protein